MTGSGFKVARSVYELALAVDICRLTLNRTLNFEPPRSGSESTIFWGHIDSRQMALIFIEVGIAQADSLG